MTADEHATDQRRFGWAALASALVVLLAYVVFVLAVAGQDFENLALSGAREEFRELRAESLAELHEITALTFGIAIAAVMAIALLRRKPVLAVAAGAVMVSSVVLTDLLQRLLVRPELIEAPQHWLSNSFPSGHVAVAVAVGIGAVLVVPYVLRPLVSLGAALYAIAIAQAVGIAGWHRLSDVVGAAFLVLTVASVALFALSRSDRMRRFVTPRRIGFTAVALLLGGATLILAGGGLLGLLEVLPVTGEPTLQPPSPMELRLAYTTSLLLGAAAIGLVFLLFLWLIRPFAIDEPAEP